MFSLIIYLLTTQQFLRMSYLQGMFDIMSNTIQ